MQKGLPQTADRMTRFLWVSVFLVAGLALSVPSGYALGGVLMWTAGLWLMLTGRASRDFAVFRPVTPTRLEREGLLVIRTCFAYGLIQFFVHFYHVSRLREVDDTIPFLLAPLLWCCLRRRESPLHALSLGISAGAIGAGGVALWQVLVGGKDRAEGFTFVIQFGDLAMLLGMLGLLGLLLVPDDEAPQRARQPVALALAGLLAGCTASLLSGSRGGWVAIVPALIIAVVALSDHRLASRVLRGVLATLAVAALVLALVPGTGVRERVLAAGTDLQGLIEEGKTLGPINERYALARIALDIIPDHPWIGHSRAEYVRKRTAIVAARGYSPVVNITGSHVHNDFLQALVRGGLLSFTGLVAMYLCPLAIGLRSLRDKDRRIRYLSAAAVMTVTMYMVFGLSQTFLNHNSGRMVFAILIPTIFALRANLRTP